MSGGELTRDNLCPSLTENKDSLVPWKCLKLKPDFY